MALQDYTDQGGKDTRSGFGVGMLELGRNNPNVVALCADLLGSLKLDDFVKEFPERFVQCGIAEANGSVAAGCFVAGKIPFATLCQFRDRTQCTIKFANR